jgi:hypothetical protein
MMKGPGVGKGDKRRWFELSGEGDGAVIKYYSKQKDYEGILEKQKGSIAIYAEVSFASPHFHSCTPSPRLISCISMHTACISGQ